VHYRAPFWAAKDEDGEWPDADCYLAVAAWALHGDGTVTPLVAGASSLVDAWWTLDGHLEEPEDVDAPIDLVVVEERERLETAWQEGSLLRLQCDAYGPVSEGLRADLDASLAQIQRDYVALAE
jgi:hypothetical protein